MWVFYALSAIAILLLFVSAGVWGLGWYLLFGVIFPYVAMVLFAVGFVYRVLKWGSSPVPFHIPTVCGQQKSLPWIKASNVESPYTTGGVVARIALEVLFFRSLFKDEKVELKDTLRLVYKEKTYLWLGAMAFHWTLFIILFRHLRFFLEPVPSLLLWIQWLDGLFQNLLPVIYVTDVIILIALGYLFFRRVIYSQVRTISLLSDYLAILLLLCIALTGILMRLFFRVDLVRVKAWVMGMLGFHPAPPEGVNLLFYIHLFFVIFLIAYFPLSKLMHMAGIFLSPTRNLKNNSRMERHLNPWNSPVKVHTYEEWEEEFKENMKKAGLTVEKE